MKMSKPAFHVLSIMLEKAADRFPSRAAYRTSGLTQRRWAFDCFWAIPASERKAWFDSFGIYDPERENLNDDHIYTALKRILC